LKSLKPFKSFKPQNLLKISFDFNDFNEFNDWNGKAP